VATDFVILYECTTLKIIAAVAVMLQYLHSSSKDISSVFVIQQYLPSGCHVCCTVVLLITFMDVSTVVAGTAVVTAVYETHIIKLLGVSLLGP
jgi:hypothetical protein